MTTVDHALTMKNTHTRRKANALNLWEILAQAIALISPSMTAALIIPLMFGTAGRMTTFAQDDLPKDPLVLKTAARHNSAHVGVYASVVTGGVARKTDIVTVR